MPPKLHEKLKRIEELRIRLNKISEGKNVTDPEVIFASQRLDDAITEYHKLMKAGTSRS